MQKDTQAVESSEYKKQQSWIRRKVPNTVEASEYQKQQETAI